MTGRLRSGAILLDVVDMDVPGWPLDASDLCRAEITGCALAVQCQRGACCALHAARNRSSLPSERHRTPNLAPQIGPLAQDRFEYRLEIARDWTMTRSTSEVAACCSSASASARLSDVGAIGGGS